MTKAEFTAAYRAARAQYPRLTRDAMAELAKVYEEAARKVAAIVVATDIKNLSELTSGAWRQIQHELEREAEKLREALKKQAITTVEKGGDIVTGIHEDYLFDVIDKASGKITEAGIVNMFGSVNPKLVKSMLNRVYTDGYSFSDRIWQVGVDMQAQIKNVVSVSLSMNRDIFDIAKDLQTYVKYGRRGLAKRYGDLIKGTKEWARRIRKDIDYNALRLVRSELYMSLQESSVLVGEMNPGCTGEYDWIRNTAEDWGCECPELAAGSPYEADNIPDFPHPNCLCTIQPRLMNSQEFYNDLKAWVNGGDVPYIQDWYVSYYKVN
jgi:hypothetical protein